jgi:plastocyanin
MNRVALASAAAGASILAAGLVVGCGGSNSTAATPASTSSAPTSALLVIEHVVRGCHSWALDGGPLKVNQAATLAAGATLSITDRDVMPHQLIEVSGPAPVVSGTRMNHMGTRMNHMGAAATVTFAKPGHYTFTTKAGEDYMTGVQTVGADHVLKLSVTVV